MRFCEEELPIIGRIAICHLDAGHDGPHRARVKVEKPRGDRRPVVRWFGVTWGEGRPIGLEPSPSIREGGKNE